MLKRFGAPESAQQPAPTPSKDGEQPAVQLDESTQKLLREINALNAYQAPSLPLRHEDRYAHTSSEVTPFRHVEPFKRHFLVQMNTPGRGERSPNRPT